jgi:transposase-like protein
MGKNMSKAENVSKPEIKRRKTYDDDFKRQVLDVWNSGTYATIVDCAKSYGINKNTVNNWIIKDKINPVVVENNGEIMSLKKELVKTKMELEILKKAAIYFANHAK